MTRGQRCASRIARRDSGTAAEGGITFAGGDAVEDACRPLVTLSATRGRQASVLLRRAGGAATALLPAA